MLLNVLGTILLAFGLNSADTPAETPEPVESVSLYAYDIPPQH